jgi:hypothetical protein
MAFLRIDGRRHHTASSINAAMLILARSREMGRSRSCGALWRSLLRTAVAILERWLD